jgi:hypothetical protein
MIVSTDLGRCMAELYGRGDGYCAGKGGAMHIAHMSLASLGPTLSLALGCRVRREPRSHQSCADIDQVSIASLGRVKRTKARS